MGHAKLACALVACACAGAPGRPLALRRVVLYQNGIGHFEHAGRHTGERFRLWVKQGEVDDVIKTLTVIDRREGGAKTVAAVLPRPGGEGSARVAIDVVLSGPREHDLSVSYAVPAPSWKATYRVALDGDAPALLQAWAMVDNVTSDTWKDVRLTLATGAPMSFASDLRTPRFVSRPDASGRLIAPTVLAPVGSERARPGDRDGDGVLDEDDLCPAEGEDRDSWEDSDGCPEADNDHDAIPDVDDKCPCEGETYNGAVDDDGCPDHGRVVVTDANIRVVEKIYFAQGSAELRAEAGPILDAIAATLRANPGITALTLAGHASGEDDPWGLSAQRAVAVRDALIARGVTARLDARPFGDTQPLRAPSGKPGDERALEINRRVELTVTARDGDEASEPAAGDATRRLEDSVRTSSTPLGVAGAVRYQLADEVTVPGGTSMMVSIVNERVPGEDALLYRPDAAVPGSDVHPLRVARLENRAGLALEPGPVAVFVGGAFAGEGLLDRLPAGETSFIPYALDESTYVRAQVSGDEEPGRLVSIARGVFVVENRELRATRYQIAAGSDPPARLFLKHARSPGYEIGALPPGTVETAAAWLIPIPLTASRTSTFTVEERRPVRRSVRLLDHDDTTLALALEGSELPASLKDKVAAAVALRRELGRLESTIETLRGRLGDEAARAAELRSSLRAIEKSPGAADLRKRLLARLGDATQRGEEASRGLAERTLELADARSKLAAALGELSLEE